MIAPQELMDMKQRMMVAAEAANRIAASNDPFVFYDQQEFEATVFALVSLRTDVQRTLAELDILRGMFSEKLAAFFQQAVKGVDASDSPSVSEGDVAHVPDATAQAGGGEVRPDATEVSGGVPAERPVRKRKGRSKPRADSGAVQVDS